MSPPTSSKRAVAKKTERYPLTSSPLYGLENHARLCDILGWAGTTGQFRAYVQRPSNYSRYHDRTKPDKPRKIEAPAERLKLFQTRLLNLLNRAHLPGYLHSARRGSSYLSNSNAHCRVRGCTVTIDIEAFYQSISDQRVARFFERTMRCSPDVAATLASLLCCDGHLATGSPASPLVSFWAFREMFDAINQRASTRNGLFTLYIDDIGLTGRGVGHTDLDWVVRLLAKNGLTVNPSKIRVFGTYEAKVVTGRAFRNGVSRAPNKQHLKMKQAELRLQATPTDREARARLVGLTRHLALLDDAKRASLRLQAAAVALGKSLT